MAMMRISSQQHQQQPEQQQEDDQEKKFEALTIRGLALVRIPEVQPAASKSQLDLSPDALHQTTVYPLRPNLTLGRTAQQQQRRRQRQQRSAQTDTIDIGVGADADGVSRQHVRVADVSVEGDVDFELGQHRPYVKASMLFNPASFVGVGRYGRLGSPTSFRYDLYRRDMEFVLKVGDVIVFDAYNGNMRGGPDDRGGGGGGQTRPRHVFRLVRYAATARERLKMAGFDPDNVSERKEVLLNNALNLRITVPPMIKYAYDGDVLMCSYLLSRGASCRGDENEWHPMYVAALRGHLDVCRWLFVNGAAQDICRNAAEDDEQRSRNPLAVSFLSAGISIRHRETSFWLILNGALSTNGDGSIDAAAMRRDLVRGLERSAVMRGKLLDWVKGLLSIQNCFQVFLMGTLTRGGPCQSPLWCFSGQSDIMELIADYTGVIRGKQLRIIRQLDDLLPGLINEMNVRDLQEGRMDEAAVGGDAVLEVA